jgi:hypothetical protein
MMTVMVMMMMVMTMTTMRKAIKLDTKQYPYSASQELNGAELVRYNPVLVGLNWFGYGLILIYANEIMRVGVREFGENEISSIEALKLKE